MDDLLDQFFFKTREPSGVTVSAEVAKTGPKRTLDLIDMFIDFQRRNLDNAEAEPPKQPQPAPQSVADDHLSDYTYSDCDSEDLESDSEDDEEGTDELATTAANNTIWPQRNPQPKFTDVSDSESEDSDCENEEPDGDDEEINNDSQTTGDQSACWSCPSTAKCQSNSKQYCSLSSGTCGSKFNRQEFRKTKAASDLKQFVYSWTLMAFVSLKCDPIKCSQNGQCVQLTSIGDAIALRREYWGDENRTPMSPTERATRMRDILSSAFSKNENKFVFKLGQRVVCERGFLMVLGLLASSGGRAPGSWSRNKASVQSGTDEQIIAEGRKLDKAAKRGRSKRDNAAAYIEYVAEVFGDTLPVAGQEGTRALPYEDVQKFFEEYSHHCAKTKVHPREQAELSTFRSAFNEKKNIRFLGCKGSFETCDICNHANDLLRDVGHYFTKEQREIVLRFKRLHLEQQAQERKFLAENKLKCLSDFDKETGNPLHALIYSDGMTAMRGETPKLGRGRHSKGDAQKKLTNRVIGVEVYCGPINEVFLYHIDDFPAGGANIMIEIQRLAMADLGALLNSEHNMALPRHIMFQFDNCGENKNKQMFAFFSSLIETGLLDQVDVNFMIVGHTHSTIDQYFSVLSTAIKDCQFIGSPMALWALFATAHSEKAQHRQPKIQRSVSVYYDMKTAYEPYINDKIKHYQVPFCFKLHRVCGKAVMQYKLFSSFPTWLPQEPVGPMQDHDAMSKLRINEITLPGRMSIVGGQDALLNGLNMADVTTNKLLGDHHTNTTFQSFKLIVPALHRMEELALENQQQRMDEEAVNRSEAEREIALKARYTANHANLAIIQRALMVGDLTQRGYIMWLDSSKVEGQPPLEELQPLPYSPASLYAQLVAQQVNPLPAADDSDDEEVDETDGKREQKYTVTPECKPQYKAACSVAAACRHMLHHVAKGRVKCSHVEGFQYQGNYLAPSEKQFYESNSTVFGVVKNLMAKYDEAPKWHPLPPAQMSASYIATCNERKAEISKLLEDMAAVSQRLLQKPGHSATDGIEIIARAKAVQQRAKQTATKETAASKKRAAAELAAAALGVEYAAPAPAAKRGRKAANNGGAAVPAPAVLAPVIPAVVAEPEPSQLDELCCCCECSVPVASRCGLCGYCVCAQHIDCADDHSHQMKRQGATCIIVEPAAPVVPLQPVIPAAPAKRGRKPAAGAALAPQKPAELPVVPVEQPVVPVEQPAVSVQPVVPVEQPVVVPLQSRGTSVGQPAVAGQLVAALVEGAAVGTPADQALRRLSEFSGEELKGSAERLFTRIVSALCGEAKKPKGGSFRGRLDAELDFSQYVKTGDLLSVATHLGIDMSHDANRQEKQCPVPEDRVKQDWKRFKAYFVVEFLSKFGFPE